ncbi:MAG: hypothetical protein AB8B63_08525 [Granulosicoccus sp.]
MRTLINLRLRVALLSLVLLFGQMASVWHTVEHMQLPLQTHGVTHGVHSGLVFSAAHHVHRHDASHEVGFHSVQTAAKSKHYDAEDDVCLIYHTATGQCAVLPAEPVLVRGAEVIVPARVGLTLALFNYTEPGYRIRAPPTFTDASRLIG